MGLLEQRAIEAAALAEVFAVLEERLGRDQAGEVLARAVENAARRAGAAFAASSPHGPDLKHFSTVLERFHDQGQGMIAEQVNLTSDSLSFDVVRCGFVEKYRSVGLSDELAYILSCRRDHPFAQGYSPRLSLERSPTIAQGQPRCRFLYRWEGQPG